MLAFVYPAFHGLSRGRGRIKHRMTTHCVNAINNNLTCSCWHHVGSASRIVGVVPPHTRVAAALQWNVPTRTGTPYVDVRVGRARMCAVLCCCCSNTSSRQMHLRQACCDWYRFGAAMPNCDFRSLVCWKGVKTAIRGQPASIFRLCWQTISTINYR